MIQIESLLSARLFMSPQRVGARIFFISNLSGRLSLYAMNYGGSVPEPLLPPDIALQNPTLMGGKPFYVFPKLEQIVVMLDQNGDENYQPMVIPIEGGFPEEAFPGALGGYRSHLELCDSEKNNPLLRRRIAGRGDSGSHSRVLGRQTGALTPGQQPVREHRRR